MHLPLECFDSGSDKRCPNGLSKFIFVVTGGGADDLPVLNRMISAASMMPAIADWNAIGTVTAVLVPSDDTGRRIPPQIPFW